MAYAILNLSLFALDVPFIIIQPSLVISLWVPRPQMLDLASELLSARHSNEIQNDINNLKILHLNQLLTQVEITKGWLYFSLFFGSTLNQCLLALVVWQPKSVLS
jgi:hypothetical protein